MRKITAALSLMASFSLFAAEADNRKFLNTDVFQLEIAGDPQISPDGSQVAYVRQSNDIMIDRLKANIWIIGYARSNNFGVFWYTSFTGAPR